MLISTRAVLLHTIKYSDSSVIAKAYTESHGIVPFMVYVGKGKKAPSKSVLLQPLTLLEVTFNPDSRSGIKRPRSWERSEALKATPFDTIKSSIALFIAEVVLRSIGEEEPNPELFKYLHGAVKMLDSSNENCSNFHLNFMIGFTRFLGFLPNRRSYVPNRMFHLVEGEFVPQQNVDPYHVDSGLSGSLYKLLCGNLENHSSVKLDTETRRGLLAVLIQYYKLHLEGMKDIRGHLILQEVLS